MTTSEPIIDVSQDWLQARSVRQHFGAPTPGQLAKAPFSAVTSVTSPASAIRAEWPDN
jgi:hypothetical protein